MNITIAMLRSEYKKAQLYSNLKVLFALFTVLPGLAAIFSTNIRMNYIFGIAGLVCLTSWVFLSWLHAGASSRHKLSRKIALLQHGLGGNFLDSIKLKYSEELVVVEKTVVQDESSNYYSSNSDKGYGRLMELVEESAFYSERTHLHSFYVYSMIVSIYVIVFFGIILVMIPTFSAGDLMMTVRSFLALTLFLLGSEILGRAIRHKHASDECRNIHEICGMSRDYFDALNSTFVLTWYLGAMDKSPETLGFSYSEAQKKKIDDEWSRRQSMS